MSEENKDNKEKDKDVKDQEKKDLTDDEINLMDADELTKVDPTEKETDNKSEEKDEETKEKADEDKTNRAGDDYKDPLAETKATLTQTQQRVAELERKNQELIENQKSSKFDDFNVLDENDEAILEDENPDDHKTYLEKKKEYDDYQTEVEEVSRKEWEKNQGSVIVAFAGDLMNIDVSTEENIKKVSEEIEKEDSEIAKKIMEVTAYADKNIKPNEKGVFSLAQLKNTHRLIYFDDILNSRLKTERESVLESIKEANTNGSAFDKIKGSEIRDSEGKALDKYSQAELYLMDEKQFDLLVKQEGIKI